MLPAFRNGVRVDLRGVWDELPAIPNTSQVHSYTIPECWEHRENFEEKCYVGQRGSRR